MTYQSDRMCLNCIQTLRVSDCNDVYVCVDERSSTKDRYLVLVLKAHDTIKRFIEICAESGNDEDDFLIHHFSDQGRYILVFPYVKRRPLSDFYVGESFGLEACEEICSNLVLSCIQASMPFPLIYLILKQGQLNLSRDLGVYLSYELDFSELDIEKTEKDCVVECARLLLSLFESKQKQKAISYALLQKKVRSFGYTKFTELYKDITISASSKHRLNIVGKLRALWNRSKDSLFHVILVLCIVLVFVAVVSLISQLIFGDIPWLSVLFNNFKQIGTESLLQ